MASLVVACSEKTNFHQKDHLNEHTSVEWKRIGEVYTNVQSECLFICTICVGYFEKFNNVFQTSDASAFWKHIQEHHLQFPLFDNESGSQMDYSRPVNYREFCAQSVECGSTEIDDSINLSKHVHAYINLPDNNHNVLTPNSHPFDNQIVDISDDEEVADSHQHNNAKTDPPIELSDDEDGENGKVDSTESNNVVSPIEDESSFSFRTSNIYNCGLCGELFVDRSQMEEHVFTHADQERIHDVPANQHGSSPTSEDTPNNVINLKDCDLLNFQCRHCHGKFSTIHQLEDHQSVHILDSSTHIQVSCETCGKYFYNENFLMNHQREMHNKGINETTCGLCQKVVEESNLESHMATEHNTVNVPLLRHMLQTHVNIESKLGHVRNSRPYKCNKCDKRTATELAMITHHEKSHNFNDRRTKRCDVCTRLILYKNYPKHLRIVHGLGAKMKCHICNKFYVRAAVYQMHMKRKHPTVEVLANPIVEDTSSLSSSTTATQSEFIPEEDCDIRPFITVYDNQEELYDEQMSDEEISFGEMIPMNT